MGHEDIDPWTDQSFFSSNVVVNSEKEQDFLNMSQHDIVLSSDDESYICPLLSTLVFGQSLRTYLIVDATLRTNLTGVFDLDDIDLDVRCLFTGDAAQDWKESAPYLIDITPDDPGRNVSDLIEQFFSEHWGLGTGIVLVTPAPMDAVWRHLRRFTRVRQENTEGWSLFRFWDPRVALPYFSGIRRWEDRSKRFFEVSGTTQTLSMVIEHPGGACCTQITPSETFPAKTNRPLPPFVLTDDDLKLLKGGVRQKFIVDVSDQAAEGWPARRAAFDNDNAWRYEISRLVADADRLGLRLDRDIRDYVAITLDKGGQFWDRKDVRAILAKPHLNTPTHKILAIRSKLEVGALV